MFESKIKHYRKRLIGGACVFALATGFAAQSMATEYNIKSQGLETALNELARQGNLQLLFDPSMVQNLQTPGVHGDLTTAEAVARILSGTGLTFALDGKDAVVIRKKKTSSPREAPPKPQTAERANPVTPVSRGIDEIIVTATRRAQSLHDVPISISAFNQKNLDDQSITDAFDLSRVTPSLNITQGESSTNRDISIRGISSSAGSSTTGIYIDDTPIQIRKVGINTGPSALPLLFDLQRVEVLRGPQGTLFGSGSEGGTIRFITPEPDLHEYSVYGRSELSFIQNGGTNYEAGIAVGGPIIENKLGFRASIWNRRNGGYVDRVQYPDYRLQDKNSNWQDNYTGRVAFKWAATDKLSIMPSFYYQKQNNNDVDAFWVGISDRSNGQFRNADPTAQSSTDELYLPAVKLKYDMGFASFISNVSYFNRKQGFDADFTTFDQYLFTGKAYPTLPNQHAISFNRYTQDNYTLEARLESQSGTSPLDWVVGIYAAKDKATAVQKVEDLFLGQVLENTYGLNIEQFFGVPLVEGRYIYDQTQVSTDKQYAIFGQLDYRLIDKLTATAGVRVTKAKFNTVTDFSGPVLGPRVTGKADQSDTSITPRFGLTYRANSDHMVYFTASKGFRVGGANPPVGMPCGVTSGAPIPGTALGRLGLTNRPLTYDSDSLWNYEVGSKNTLLNGRLQVNMSVFHIDWSNIQQSVVLGACGFNFTQNLGSVDSNGVEANIIYQATPNFNLSLALGYIDTKYAEDVFGGPAATRSIISKGDHIAGPPWTVHLSARYDLPLYGHDSYVRLDYDYQAHLDKLTQSTNPLNGGFDPISQTRPGTHFVVARIGMEINNFDVSLFADNLLNSHPQLTRGHDASGSPLIRSTSFRPRSIGIRVIFR